MVDDMQLPCQAEISHFRHFSAHQVTNCGTSNQAKQHIIAMNQQHDACDVNVHLLPNLVTLAVTRQGSGQAAPLALDYIWRKMGECRMQ